MTRPISASSMVLTKFMTPTFTIGRASLCKLELSLAILMSFAVLPAHGAQLRENYFKKQTVCNNTYGTTIGQLPNVRGWLTCAHECSNTSPCESLTYDAGTKLCTLNNQPWYTAIATGCSGNTVLYAEKGCLNKANSADDSARPVCASGSACTNPVKNMRLCDGGGAGVCDPTQGRLEVYYNNQWGTVCDDLYTVEQKAMANLTCIWLGYTIGTPLLSAPFGQGVDPIWMDDVLCTGTECSLLHCGHLGWGSHNCGHHEDLGIVCS